MAEYPRYASISIYPAPMSGENERRRLRGRIPYVGLRVVVRG